MLPVRGERLAAARDLCPKLTTIAVRPAACLCRKRGERELCVGDDAELSRVIASDFRFIRVDVHEPRGRN